MIEERAYQICNRCVMDTTAKEITFNDDGICNFCSEFEVLAHKTIWRPLAVRQKELIDKIERIKQFGRKDQYNCLIGLSGGVDSSYICHWVKEEGLRPLIVHFDNGWNSELAIRNIEKIISKTGFDLYTYVINWEEFKDLQLSYLKASVVDIEVPTDQLIIATLFKVAKKFKIKTIISGTNLSSEAILPESWVYMNKTDLVNLTNIHRKFGTVKLKDFPKLSMIQRYINSRLYQLESVAPLDLLDYDKDKAKKFLMHEYDWKDYGGKHYESVFTRFYQGYILPEKFGIDKRRAHLATLVAAKLKDREAALEELKQPTYDPKLQQEDINYVCKKFGIPLSEFEHIMKQPRIEHSYYGTEWDNKEFRKFYYFRKIFGPVTNLISKIKA